MIIKSKSYSKLSKSHTRARVIYEFYLDGGLRNVLQVQDIGAIYHHCIIMKFDKQAQDIETFVALIENQDLTIFYEQENLTKTIPKEIYIPALNAIHRYEIDRHDHELTKEEDNFLIELNRQLHALEYEIRDEFRPHWEQMEALLVAGHPFLTDYEMECTIHYYLDENDSLGNEDNGYLLYEDEFGLHPSEDEMLEFDYNEVRDHVTAEANQIYKVAHCGLFHQLENHSNIPLKHLCRISFIWVDVKITWQKQKDLIRIEELRNANS